MDKEALELQQRLLDKLNEWKNSPEFGKSKYDNQKYNRAKISCFLSGCKPNLATIHSSQLSLPLL